MADEDTAFDTMGEDFAVVGYDDVGAPLYTKLPRGSALARPVANPQRSAALARRVMPGRAMANAFRVQPGVAMPGAAGLTEGRIRAIVHEEMLGNLPTWFSNASQVPGAGAPVDGELMSPLGLEGSPTDTLTSVVPTVRFIANPQRPFRGERLIISLARSAGATAIGVGIDQFKIGENSQLVGDGLVPAESFAPDAFGVRLAMSAAEPGVLIALTLTAVVPAGESIVAQVAIVGRAVWGPRG